MTRTFWFAALLLALGPAWAQSLGSPQISTQPGTRGSPGETGEGKSTMKTLDRDMDGRVSAREAQTHPELSQRFESLDRDGNSQLDKAEFAQFEVGGQTDESNRRSRGNMNGATDSDDQDRERRQERKQRHRDSDQGRAR